MGRFLRLAFHILFIINNIHALPPDPLKTPFQDEARKILSVGLREEKSWALLRDLLEAAPNRLTGSPGAAAALEHMRKVMEGLGFENVHLEPVTVNRWVRGEERASLRSSSGRATESLAVCALGGSVGTPAGGIRARVVEVKSFEEFRALGSKVHGKIVFYNRPMDRTVVESFAAYGRAADQRVRGAVEAAKLGAAAVLIRSLTFRLDDAPHTGLMHYENGVARIPAAALSTKSAELLSRRLREDPSATFHLTLGCKDFGPVSSANLIGDIRGSEYPGEIILIGGHIDSWDLGPGAHDDAAGCIHAVEALRLIKEAGLVPKRTIRAVMFMDEEFGGTGGRFYARAPERKSEKHLVAFESDRGGLLPLAIGLGTDPARLEKFKSWDAVVRSVGLVLGIVPGGGGVDIAPLAEHGVRLGGLIPDAHRYFDYHHSASDIPAAVHPRELELGAVGLAVISYMIAQDGL